MRAKNTQSLLGQACRVQPLCSGRCSALSAHAAAPVSPGRRRTGLQPERGRHARQSADGKSFTPWGYGCRLHERFRAGCGARRQLSGGQLPVPR